MENTTPTDTAWAPKQQAFTRAFEITLKVATRLKALEELREAVENTVQLGSDVLRALSIVQQVPEVPEDFFRLVDQEGLMLTQGRGNA